jgi:DNA-binding CsgD family transcriptional regulator
MTLGRQARRWRALLFRSRVPVVYAAAGFGVLLGMAALMIRVEHAEHARDLCGALTSSSQSPAGMILGGVGGFGFLAAGMLAHARQPANRVGPLMVLVGGGYFAEDLQLSSSAWVHSVGLLLPHASSGFATHLVLAFPSGRLTSSVERLLVWIAYAAVFVLTPVAALFTDTSQRCLSRSNLLLISGDTAVPQVLGKAVEAIAGVVAVGVVAVLVRRWVRAGLPMRRVLAPVLLAGLVGGAATAVYGIPGENSYLGAFLWVYLAAFCLLPLGFLAWVLSVRRPTAVGTLLGQLRKPLSASELEAALARALGDPSLQVGYWRPDAEEFVDGTGRPLRVPDAGSGCGVTLVEPGGRRVAVLVHDLALREDPHRLNAVVAAAELTLENQRLAAEVRAQAEERASRGQTMAAGDAERRRLASGRELDVLTIRELEVLALMAEGCSNQAIAKQLCLSVKTVESHVRNIFTRLGLPPHPDHDRRVLAVRAYLRDQR